MPGNISPLDVDIQTFFSCQANTTFDIYIIPFIPAKLYCIRCRYSTAYGGPRPDETGSPPYIAHRYPTDLGNITSRYSTAHGGPRPAETGLAPTLHVDILVDPVLMKQVPPPLPPPPYITCRYSGGPRPDETGSPLHHM